MELNIHLTSEFVPIGVHQRAN